MTAGTGIAASTALPAAAAPVYEITARWADDVPATAKSGDVVNAEWRVNVNDDAAAPSNEPVDNVNFTLTIENGAFAELPDSCLVEGVDPVSSISEDGKTLVCNIGTQDQGTAHVLQTPIVVDGETGSQLTGTGTIEGGSAALTPIEVVNDFGMDIRWSVATNSYQLNNYPASPTVDLDLQWTLSKDRRSEPGPQTVSYDLTFSGAISSIAVGAQQCTPFTTGVANGHPWSGGTHPGDQMVSPVDSCTIQQTGPNTFRLTLTGIDYDPANPPTKDSTGAALPVDQVALASGSIWLRIVPSSAGSVTLTSSTPTYTAPSGATTQDDPTNNTVTKTWLYPGAYTAPWARGFTGSGGSFYDDTYRVSAGTTINQALVTGYPGIDRADNLPVGLCAPIDTRYLTFERFNYSASSVPGAVVSYYVGNAASVNPAPGNLAYNPEAFDCGVAAGWTTTPPADLSTVKAVRVTMTQGQAETIDTINAAWSVNYKVKNDVQPDQDIWSFAFGQAADGSWSNPGGCVTNTPGLRYQCTLGGYRDLVRIAATTPYIEKSSDRSTITPGTPANFSLTYSANVPSNLPESVDGYQIIDTLPMGMTYVDGSADPAPTVSTNGSGQQVLTWAIDDVATNTPHVLTYQAVANSSVEPGDVLTNSATATVSGVTSLPVTAQVTVSTNGYTSIGKSADTPFIPNLAGDGVGEGSWTVTLRSFDPLPQNFTDTIDILPYNGDGRGTDFAGEYTLAGVDVGAGATVYYTTADPATLSDDPAHASNGAPGAVTGNTVGWSTTFTPDATAVRVIGPELAPGATQAFTVNVTTDGVEGGDVLVNRAQARDGHTELVMRTSAPITVANYYSAALKKEVLDTDGVWRDANTVEDYPSFKVGDTIRYRITVENTGQGTLTGIEVSDDKQPELGSFVIDTLAPGEEQSHEFEIVADASVGDGVVNTACATADIPEDSQVPPTINCDPAGFEVDGDPTHVKELISATPVGNGQWELVYGIDVSNASTASTSYSLDDELHFTSEATIESAQVTSAPAGVTLATPAWDGQDNTLIAANVPLAGNDDAGYAPHHYEVTVVASVPLQIPGAGSGGASDPTACPAEDGVNLDADTAFNNVSTMTPPDGEAEEDQACAELPSIDVTKSVTDGPSENGDGTWTVVYDIVATNDGAGDGVYDVSDRMTADGDITVVSGDVVTTPDGVTPNTGWTGLGAEGDPANVIASDVPLASGGVHTYQVEVVIGLAEGAEGEPVLTDCSATPGGAGGLSNGASVTHNDLSDSDEACVTVTNIVVDKTVSSGPTPNGDGTYTVVYDIVAENVGPAAGDYDVTDRLHFGEGIEILDAAITTAPDGVETNADWTGLGTEGAAENVVASDVTLASGATHTYQVTVTVQLDEATIDPSELQCPPPGSGENGGLANSTTLDHNGIVAEDEVCPTLPLIEFDKELTGGPTPNGDGTWTLTYDLTAQNVGQAAGEYDLHDQLRFGNGIVIESADVTTTPDGVADPTGWTGQGADIKDAANLIASGVNLDASVTHTYQVQVVASLDLDVVTPGDLACPAPGSGEPGGFANTGELTHNGEDQEGEACAEPPLIDITKSLSGAVTPVAGQDGVYDATYEITVSNRGPGAGSYDLDDELAPGEGVEIVGIQDVVTNAPASVGVNEGFDGLEDTRIVTAQPIDGAGTAPVVHTYTVTVRYALDLTDVVIDPSVDVCTTPDGGTVAGGLNNIAAVDWNGIPGQDDECVRPGKPTLDKALVSANPVGDGKWEVVYDLTVGNVGTEATTYDLDDELLFAPVISVDSVTVTGPDGVTLNEGFDGDTDQRIATDVSIGGLDDEGYAPHVYRVTVVANVPLHITDVEDDGTGSPACTVPAGGNTLEQGLNNAATLTDETGGTQTDTDCAPVPSIDITKVMDGDPVKGSDGSWTVNYTITATNDGAATGSYTLADRLRYGAGIQVKTATVTATPEGVTASGTWTGQGAAGAPENVVASEVELAAGGTHTYQVQVVASLDAGAVNESTFTCPEPGSDGRGGFANTAGLDHNDLTATDEVCETPDKPGDPGRPGKPGGSLATTGATLAWVAGGAALLMLIGALALIIARNRRTTIS